MLLLQAGTYLQWESEASCTGCFHSIPAGSADYQRRIAAPRPKESHGRQFPLDQDAEFTLKELGQELMMFPWAARQL